MGQGILHEKNYIKKNEKYNKGFLKIILKKKLKKKRGINVII